jgi:hypothetical protein
MIEVPDLQKFKSTPPQYKVELEPALLLTGMNFKAIYCDDKR